MEGAQEEGEEGPLDELFEHQTHSVKAFGKRMLKTLISNWFKSFLIKNGNICLMRGHAMLLLVAAEKIIMVKEVVWRFVGEEGSSVGLKNIITVLMNRMALI